MSDQPKKPVQSEMERLREELLRDPKVRIGTSVLRDWKQEQTKTG